jgi:hypothetical protein
MHDRHAPRLSRREALNVGVGIAAAAAAGGGLETVFAAAGVSSNTDAGEAHIAGVGTVQAVNGPSVTARMAGGEAVSARLSGFPPTVLPRAGDLVAIDRGMDRPLCAKGSAPSPIFPAAHPLCHWSVGIPTVQGSVVAIGTIRLAASTAVLQAAKRRAHVAICTLDSTLADRQVLSIRPA